MIIKALRLVASAGLLMVVYGGAIAIGACVMAAVVIHFVAP
jgi:hypothetical protein